MFRLMAILVLGALALVPASPAQGAARRVPQGFMGVMADGPIFDRRVDVDSELGAMARSGVETVRVAVYWDRAQPYRSAADVPSSARGRFVDEDGVPTDWSAVDAFMRGAGRHRLGVLPVLLRAPAWAAKHPGEEWSPPASARPYARFAAAAVRRYRPGSPFWRARPAGQRISVRQWQVWNEPNGPDFWTDQPGIPAYARLLAAAHDAIKRADPGARVVAAGLVGRSWEALEGLYRRIPKGDFDVVAIHPFTRSVTNVVKILELGRAAMRRHGDARKPIIVSELSWPAAAGRTRVRFGYEVSRAGQAVKVRDAYGVLSRERRRLGLEKVLWYSWLSRDRDRSYPFDWAGLRHFGSRGVSAKPALTAYTRVARRLEGCAKAAQATHCR